MTKTAKLMAEDLDVAMQRVKLRKGLQTMHKGRSNRKHELHVSDFTQSEKQFCYRKLVIRWLRGDGREDGGMSWVEYDGKFREEKWRRLFEAAGMLREYQLALKVGPLSGHPDFVVDFGKGNSIVELTGHDSKIDPILRNAREAVKKRQCLAYVIMYRHMVGKLYRGFVYVEDKGNNDFRIIPVDYDEEKARLFMERVVRVTRATRALAKATTTEQRASVIRAIPKCERPRCQTCYAKPRS